MLIVSYVSTGQSRQCMQKFLMKNYKAPYHCVYEERYFTYTKSPHTTRKVYNDAKGLDYYVIGTARFNQYFAALLAFYTRPDDHPFVNLWGDAYKAGKIVKVKPPRGWAL